jgi:hypothetical protein
MNYGYEDNVQKKIQMLVIRIFCKRINLHFLSEFTGVYPLKGTDPEDQFEVTA